MYLAADQVYSESTDVSSGASTVTPQQVVPEADSRSSTISLPTPQPVVHELSEESSQSAPILAAATPPPPAAMADQQMDDDVWGPDADDQALAQVIVDDDDVILEASEDSLNLRSDDSGIPNEDRPIDKPHTWAQMLVINAIGEDVNVSDTVDELLERCLTYTFTEMSSLQRRPYTYSVEFYHESEVQDLRSIREIDEAEVEPTIWMPLDYVRDRYKYEREYYSEYAMKYPSTLTKVELQSSHGWAHTIVHMPPIGFPLSSRDPTTSKLKRRYASHMIIRDNDDGQVTFCKPFCVPTTVEFTNNDPDLVVFKVLVHIQFLNLRRGPSGSPGGAGDSVDGPPILHNVMGVPDVKSLYLSMAARLENYCVTPAQKDVVHYFKKLVHECVDY